MARSAGTAELADPAEDDERAALDRDDAARRVSLRAGLELRTDEPGAEAGSASYGAGEQVGMPPRTLVLLRRERVAR